MSPREQRRGLGHAGRASLLRAARDPSSSLLLAQLAVAGAAFVANIMAARALEPAGRGELALLLQIAYLSSLGLLLGTDRSTVAVFTDSTAAVVTRAVGRLLLRPVLAGLCVTVVAVIALPVAGQDGWLGPMLLAAAFAVVNAFVRSMRSVAIAAGRHRDFVRATIASQLLLLLTMVCLLVIGAGAVGAWLAAYLVAGALPTAVCFLHWRHGGGSVRPSWSQLRGARREGLALLPAAVADSGMLRLDRLLLPVMASTSALGVYASVGTMTELLAWPLLAYADARVGRWRVATDAGQLDQRRVIGLATAYVLGAGVVLAIAITALIVPLLGTRYEPAKDLVVPLIAAAAVYGLAQVFASLLLARHRGSSASFAATAGFVVSVVAYLVLIPTHGAAGAAYGSLIGYTASLICAAVALSRATDRTPTGGERP